jgi:predicted transcriptional regulator
MTPEQAIAIVLTTTDSKHYNEVRKTAHEIVLRVARDATEEFEAPVRLLALNREIKAKTEERDRIASIMERLAADQSRNT